MDTVKPEGLNLANKITIARIILTPFFIGSIIYNRLDIALVFFILAVISDGLDGFIARTRNQKTQLGTILDPIADKVLLVSAYIAFSVATNLPSYLRLPAYVPIIIISRDALIVLGTVVIFLLKGDIKVQPTISGKLTTFLQMMTIVSLLVQFKYSYIIWNAAVLLTVISGISYLIKGSRMMNGNHIMLGKKAGTKP